MNRTTHILLIRHGQTEANASGVLQGHQPTPLNLTGIRQAMLLAGRLKSMHPPIDVLVSSDLARATQTAAPIASACGLKLVLDPAWRERGFGTMEGVAVGHKETWQAASGETNFPGAEPAAAMHERVRAALVALPDRFPKAKMIAVVTHGGPIRAVLRMLVDERLRITRGQRAVEMQQIANCSILELAARRYRDGLRWRVACVNDAAHLEDVVTSGDSG